jgi:hypothetical protein
MSFGEADILALKMVIYLWLAFILNKIFFILNASL